MEYILNIWYIYNSVMVIDDGPNLWRVKKVDVSSTHGVPIQSLDGIYIKDMVYKVSQYRA